MDGKVLIFSNQMLRDGPILFDAIDSDSYVARPELEDALLTAAQAGGGMLLLGPAGSGRTTLLNWLALKLREQAKPVTRVDAALTSEPETVLELIREGLRQAHRSSEVMRRLSVPSTLGENPPDALRLQEAVRSLGGAPSTVVLLDNLTDRQTIRTIFGGLRDLLWETGHRWVVTARPADRSVFLAPPADSFFADRLEILPLTEGELMEFVRRSDIVPRAASDRLADVRRTPRDVVRALRRNGSPTSALVEAQRAVGDAAADVLREVVALGHPVAPDDASLLARTSLSEVTIRKYLNRLAVHGFLDRIDDRTGRPGRPRKVYAPVTRSVV